MDLRGLNLVQGADDILWEEKHVSQLPKLSGRRRNSLENTYLFNCALEQCGFLGYKGDHFAVFSDIEFGDVAAIAQDFPLLNFVEAKDRD
jgi:hypothetical protein